MSYDEAKSLLNKYRNGQATEAEQAIVERWLFGIDEKPVQLPEAELLELQQQVWDNMPLPGKVRTITMWPRYAAAAILLIVLGFGGYVLLKTKPTNQVVVLHDRAPGGNKAYLTLANGKKIVLTGAKNGRLAQQGSVTIVKDKDGQLTYGNGAATQPNALNTMSTPRGGYYTLKLADGTDVMLDAASSITYPVAFTGKERRVSVTGQVYFKVKHDEAHPFIVSVNGQEVQDIGTEFNINGYADEPATKTTLVSGSIKIGNTVLKPGQQYNGTTVKTVDIDDVTAWTEGNFQFKDEPIESVMRKLARWYDVDVVYEGTAGMTGFGGTVSRSKNLSVVLKVLESTGAVHFKVEGRRVTVMP